MSEITAADCTFYGTVYDLPFKLVLGPKADPDYVPEEPTDPTDPTEPPSTATSLAALVKLVKAIDVRVTENAKDIASLEKLFNYLTS
jgi:hypothetical protein